MRAALLERLRCPHCHSGGSLVAAPPVPADRELRDGSVTCSVCAATRTVRYGIVDLMPGDLPRFVSAEAAGLDRFADLMRADGWTRERVLELPYIHDGYWYAQATALQQTLDTPELALTAGKRILDVGSNTCWASALFAEHGLDVTALDINAGEMQGLRTADWWFEARGVYFERVLGVMFDLPFADDSFDFAWCCEVLHHNHRANLHRTMRELARVLRPGGSVIVVNEPCRSLRHPKLRPGHEVADYDGHEHVFQPRSYSRAARQAGLRVRLVTPWTVPMFRPHTFQIAPDASVWRAAWVFIVHCARHVPALRRAALAYKQYVDGAASFYMVATKPEARS
jgi:SAM-dependent methyltransferase